jgi:hypothetical protein
MLDGIMRKSAGSIPWQDYRSSNKGMIVTYDTDPVSELAIREVPEELPSAVLPEPNYESGTYGLYGCSKTKIRNAFYKEKLRYIFFVARYQGAKVEFRDKHFVTGVYRVHKTADVHKLHLRYLAESNCIDIESCMALLADQVHFVAVGDALEVTAATQELWGYKAKFTKQTRIILDENHTKNMLEYLLSKPNVLAKYIEETRRLSPEDPNAGEDGDDAGDSETVETSTQTETA